MDPKCPLAEALDGLDDLVGRLVLPERRRLLVVGSGTVSERVEELRGLLTALYFVLRRNRDAIMDTIKGPPP